MRIRGVIEGFYGPPWSHDARLGWIDLLDDLGFTHYVWAAKAEPRHRDAWREPFTAAELDGFAELARRRPGVRLAVGLTPGPGATAGDVVAKLAPAVRAGASAVVLSADDLPALDAGADHRALAHALLDGLEGLDGPDGRRAGTDRGVEVWVVPTHYCGVDDSPYLRALCDGLDPRVELIWTGRHVVNDTITAADARRRGELTGRAPLLWDNTPVNDGPMRDGLHLGPLGGRDRALVAECAGALWNPMEFPLASTATIRSAAAWLGGDDPVEAWRADLASRGWLALAVATSHPGDAHWPAGRTPAAWREWWREVVAELPLAAADVGLDDAVQPWIDAAREGAEIALDAIALAERLRDRAPTTSTALRQLLLAARWRAWRRRDALTFGAGPRLRPVLSQDARGEFVAVPAAAQLDESLVDAAVRDALPT
jgi:hypothetical protein